VKLPHRLTRIGPLTRIGLTLAVAAILYGATSAAVEWHLRLLVAWCGGALFFLLQIAAMFASLDADGVRERSQQSARAEGHAPMLVGVVLTVLASIGTVMYLLNRAQAQTESYRLYLALSPIAIAESWLVLQATFAVYYARLYYEPAAPGRPEAIGEGLQFPTPVPPDYWDFLYFSTTLAMCYQVSDVTVTSRFIRRVVMVQCLISFFYYTVLIGLVMNLIGTLF
jgi:uncharacterized membrane protein